MACGIFPNQGQTPVPCIGRRTLIPQATISFLLSTNNHQAVANNTSCLVATGCLLHAMPCECGIYVHNPTECDHPHFTDEETEAPGAELTRPYS